VFPKPYSPYLSVVKKRQHYFTTANDGSSKTALNNVIQTSIPQCALQGQAVFSAAGAYSIYYNINYVKKQEKNKKINFFFKLIQNTA
jgi:hypothetical protein